MHTRLQSCHTAVLQDYRAILPGFGLDRRRGLRADSAWCRKQSSHHIRLKRRQRGILARVPRLHRCGDADSPPRDQAIVGSHRPGGSDLRNPGSRADALRRTTGVSSLRSRPTDRRFSCAQQRRPSTLGHGARRQNDTTDRLERAVGRRLQPLARRRAPTPSAG